ncbi:MAG: Fur family transcriptional regulator [Oceanospirillaceae bacterium]|nr:Fur family transcriptional regulator [Oceanospirillaceae bacterium]
MTQNVYRPHDHSTCIDNAMEQAKAVCEQNGARLTKVRQRVLELVWSSHKPVGAYDLLPLLANEGFNSAPPTVYRALDFLLELGLIHRLASLNAYVGCSHPGHGRASCFFLCQSCGKAQELESQLYDDLSTRVESTLGVKIDHQITELSGICPSCLDQSS